MLEMALFERVEGQFAYFGRTLSALTLSRITSEWARLAAMLWRAVLDDEKIADDSNPLPSQCPELFPPLLFAACTKKVQQAAIAAALQADVSDDEV
jgi:hypothetical protein